MRNLCRSAALILLSLLIALATPAGSASASPTVITASVQASFDLTAAAADNAARVRLKSQYSELSLLSAQYDSREVQIRTLHDQNAEALIVVREAIKNIDQASVTKLTAAVSSTKERYQPLFDQYSALNKRISLLKGLKDKTLNSVLKAQAEAMKLLVQLARQEIRDKEALLKADWSDFKSAVRKQNSALAGQSLASMVSGYRQIAASKLKIIEYEQKIAAIITATHKQIGT
jgi:hypothetical protein